MVGEFLKFGMIPADVAELGGAIGGQICLWR